MLPPEGVLATDTTSLTQTPTVYETNESNVINCNIFSV